MPVPASVSKGFRAQMPVVKYRFYRFLYATSYVIFFEYFTASASLNSPLQALRQAVFYQPPLSPRDSYSNAHNSSSFPFSRSIDY
jgi:hypothetical protein